ncbi:hypothetical protein [Ferrovibrio sp.]|uniref:hypothetical protein n=1 Tax=Ferrovibrio sp. TaxID=1917215 RepID=UPI003D13CF1E
MVSKAVLETLGDAVKKFVTVSAVLLCGLVLNGCVYPDPTYNMYAPGGALADKSEGPVILASADDNMLKTMFPVGTGRDRVMQSLGVPKTTSSNSDGTTVQIFSHTFTSYQRKVVQMNMLTVTYDPEGKVKSTALTKTNSTW